MIKVGIFGGSFNPVHNGHIHLAETVKNKLELDKVIMIPANISPDKNCNEYADKNDRFEMCRLASEGKEWLEVSNWEIMQNNISYTYNTIIHFKEKYPDYQLYLMVGSDICFDKWYKYKEILKNVTLVFVSREKDDFKLLEIKCQKLSKYGNVVVVKTEPLVISSSEIRKSIKNHQFCSCYLSEKVVQYIEQKKLYKTF